jgi:16S rRNA processing protein RimM
VASILRPQGRRGEVLCVLLTDFPEKFSERSRVFLFAPGDVAANRAEAAREVELEDFWMPQGKNAGRVVLKLGLSNSITEAEKLAGLEVAIPLEERAALEEGEFFTADLLDCEIVTAAGTIGRVAEVDHQLTGSPLLVVRNDSGEEFLVPLVKAYLKHTDIAGKRLEMELPEGLLEINKPDPKEKASEG